MSTITGLRLKKLRKNLNLPQSKVAKLIGISRTTYLKYESGELHPVNKLNELCSLYNVSADYILGYSVDVEPENEKENLLRSMFSTNKKVLKFIGDNNLAFYGNISVLTDESLTLLKYAILASTK